VKLCQVISGYVWLSQVSSVYARLYQLGNVVACEFRLVQLRSG